MNCEIGYCFRRPEHVVILLLQNNVQHVMNRVPTPFFMILPVSFHTSQIQYRKVYWLSG